MATSLITQAIEGFIGVDTDCPYLYSSPSWYAWKAGELLRIEGTHTPKTAHMGRGYSVTVSFFNGAKTTVKFDKNDKPSIA
jgi:hypothetical protein